MWRRVFRGLCGLALILVCAPWGASASSDLSLTASLQGRGGIVTDVPLDTEKSDGGLDGGMRLRLHGVWRTAPRLALVTGLDLDGLGIFGAAPEVEAVGWDRPYRGLGGEGLRLELRDLYLTYTTAIGEVRIGQMGSQWGLGLLANDGAAAPAWGVSRQGDIVDRLLFATLPFAWLTSAPWAKRTFLVLGGDIVFRDEYADLIAGDLALEGIASLFYRREAGARELGFYVAYRAQHDRPDESGLRSRLDVLALDAYGAWRWQLCTSVHLSLAGEIAALEGRTDRLRTEAAPDGVKVQALGWVVRPEIAWEHLGVSLGAWVGYASGDDDPEDGRLTQMRLDPEFRPAVVLFEEVLARQSAWWAVRARDPSHGYVPPAGTQYLPTESSVSGASFFGPQVRWRSTFVDGLVLRAGLLFARSTSLLADPYASFEAGGAPTTAFGTAAASRDLGVELDVGARWTREVREHLELAIEMEYGHLFPGAAFELPAGRMAPVTSTWIGAELVWRLGAEE